MLFFKLVDFLLDLLPAFGEPLAEFLRNALDFKSGNRSLFAHLPDVVAERLYLASKLVLIDLPGISHRLEHSVFMESKPFSRIGLRRIGQDEMGMKLGIEGAAGVMGERRP